MLSSIISRVDAVWGKGIASSYIFMHLQSVSRPAMIHVDPPLCFCVPVSISRFAMIEPGFGVGSDAEKRKEIHVAVESKHRHHLLWIAFIAVKPPESQASVQREPPGRGARSHARSRASVSGRP